MKIFTENNAKEYNALSFAFLGDSVYELWVRSHLLNFTDMKNSKLHDIKTKFVCAEFQSFAVDKIIDFFDEKEINIYRRGHNAKGLKIPKHSTISEYRKATGLEAVLGYLYLLKKIERIEFLMKNIFSDTEFNAYL